MKELINNKIAVLGALAIMSAASMAYGYYTALPGEQRSGNISYVTGGIGDEDRTALEQSRGQYNLRIISFGHDGAFSGDSRLAIYDKMGNEVLSADAGPLFYAKLPAGKYYISNTYEGADQKKEIKVSYTPLNVHFIW